MTTTDRPNVVLVTADSVRADHCGHLGSEYDLTPALDSLAEEGVVFETAVAPGPRTPSSMPPAFTGGIHDPIDRSATWEQRYAHIRSHLQRRHTLPERLRDRGYTTLGFTANPWTRKTGFEDGFDTFVELSSDYVTSNGSRSLGLRALEGVMSIDALADRVGWRLKRTWFLQWPQFYEAILETVRAVPEPYFLWVFLLDSHQPYIVPRQFRQEVRVPEMYYGALRQYLADFDEPLPDHVRRALTRGYRDAIRAVDGFVERIRGDLDATLVFHSDHGEAFGDHGTYGHRHALYEENIHVPLLVHGHDGGRGGETVTDPTSLRQLPNLVTSLADARDGTVDPQAFARPYAFATTEYGTPSAVRGRRWKYVVDSEHAELYDLAADPDERTDRSTDRPDVARVMDGVLDRYDRHLSEQRAIATAAGEVEG